MFGLARSDTLHNPRIAMRVYVRRGCTKTFRHRERHIVGPASGSYSSMK